MLRKWYLISDNQIERTISDLRRDDGQHIPMFVDKVAGAVEEVQNARVTGIRQPVTDGAREGKGV